MFTLIVTEKGGSPKRLEFDKDEVTIGRVPGNDVILPKGNVSKRHSRVVRQDGRFFVVDLKSTNGTYLNGRRITTPSVIRPGDKIYVGDFVVVVDTGEGAALGPPVGGGGEEALESAVPSASSQQMPPPQQPPPPVAAEASVAPPPLPAENSIIEPLPLDREPPDSERPPAPLITTPNRTPSSVSGSMAARPGMMTQQLGSSTGTSPPGGAASMGLPGARSATQPPPGRPSTLSGPGRAPAGVSSGSVPAVNPGGSPRTTVSGTGAAMRPASMSGASPAVVPPAQPPRPAGASSMPGAPGSQPDVGMRRGPSPAGVSAPVSRSEPPAPLDEEAAGLTPPPVSAPAAAAVAIPPATAAAAASTTQPSAATLNIAPSVVDAVIQSHRALSSAGIEPTPPSREYADLLADVIAEARTNGAASPGERLADAATRARVRQIVEGVARSRDALPSGVTTERLVRDAVAEIAGGGAIETALEEPDVTTVIVEPTGRVLIGRGDAVGPSPYWFSADTAVIAVVDRLLHASGLNRTPGDAIVEATLSDGARLLAVLPPVAPTGPSVVVERPPAQPATLIDLAAREMLTTAAVTVLNQALAARRNIVVTGPRGSGRTTLLAALVASVAPADRCVLVEDRREVGRALPNVTSIDARGEWKRAIDIALRLRPQRVVVGEVNEASAPSLVSLLATGAEGLLVAAEGPSPQLALTRLASLAGAAGAGLSREEAAARIAATRPLVVHTARLGDGTCRVVAIGEARAADAGGIHVDEAFAIRVDGPSPHGRLAATLAATGVVPSFGSGG